MAMGSEDQEFIGDGKWCAVGCNLHLVDIETVALCQAKYYLLLIRRKLMQLKFNKKPTRLQINLTSGEKIVHYILFHEVAYYRFYQN